jgi:hypothetical protein
MVGGPERLRKANGIQMTEPEFVDPKQIRKGRIRNHSLAPELLQRIGLIFKLIGPYVATTLEEFEIGFMRDSQPEREVAIWAAISAAWLAYHKRYLESQRLAIDQEKKLLGALLLISAGVDDASQLKVPEDVGRRLLECYESLGRAG